MLLALLSAARLHANTAPVVDEIENVTVTKGKPLVIPVTAFDNDYDVLSYTVQSDNPAVTVQNTSGNPYMRMTVEGFGDMVFELFRDRVPLTTDIITGLVNSRFYNGTIFHRLIPTFMVQGGDPSGTGAGGSAYEYADEQHPDLIFTGKYQLAMANAGDDTNRSQFFITFTQTRWLDFGHTIFGQLVRGKDVADTIEIQPRDAQDRPINEIRISEARMIKNRFDCCLIVKATAAPLTANITVIASDGKGGSHQRTFTVTSINDPDDNCPPFLYPIPDQTTPANTLFTYPLSAFDLEGDSVIYDAADLGSPQAAQVFVSNGTLYVNPVNGFTGEIPIGVAIRQNVPPFDWDSHYFYLGVGVAPITLTPAQVNPILTMPFEEQVLATFTVDHPDPSVNTYLSYIYWGDGFGSLGTVEPGPGNTYKVKGTNSFPGAGLCPTAVYVLGSDGASAKTIVNIDVQRRLVRMDNRGANHPLAEIAKDNFLFKVYGRVTVVDDVLFILKDGAKNMEVKVYAGGHGLTTGDYAHAVGPVIFGGTNATMVVEKEDVHKYE